MVSSVAGSNSDGFVSVGTHDGVPLYTYSPFRAFYDPASRLQEAVTTIDDNMLRNVKRRPCSILPAALKWTEAASNTYCNYDVPIA
jgi:hypothetical protein